MPVKVYRRFIGGYIPNADMLIEKNVIVQPIPVRSILVSTNQDQGMGRIEGMVRDGGLPKVGVPVHLFNRSTKSLLWEVKTDTYGKFKFKNIAPGLECYVIVFDTNRKNNAKVKDMIIAR